VIIFVKEKWQNLSRASLVWVNGSNGSTGAIAPIKYEKSPIALIDFVETRHKRKFAPIN